MKRVTISEAARATGVFRTTIQRAIRQGRLPKGKDGLVALVDLANAGFRLLNDSEFVETLIRSNEELEIENAQWRADNDNLSHSLRGLEALAYRQSGNREKVRRLDLMPRPDAQIIYSVDAAPPTIVLPTEDDNGLHPFARQCILAAQLFPHSTATRRHQSNCHEQRQTWLEAEWASIVLWDLEDAAMLSFSDQPIPLDPLLVTTAAMCQSHTIRDEAVTAFQRGFMAGNIFVTFVQQTMSRGGASIRKACAHIVKTLEGQQVYPFFTRTSCDSLQRDWEEFRDVAHFWAAVVLLVTTSKTLSRPTPSEFPSQITSSTTPWRHNPLLRFATLWAWRHYGIKASRQNSCVHLWGSHGDFTKFLVMSEAFRRFGMQHRLHAQDTPMLNPQTAWTLGQSNSGLLFSPDSEIPPLDISMPGLSAS